jgi:hypothetical protein
MHRRNFAQFYIRPKFRWTLKTEQPTPSIDVPLKDIETYISLGRAMLCGSTIDFGASKS